MQTGADLVVGYQDFEYLSQVPYLMILHLCNYICDYLERFSVVCEVAVFKEESQRENVGYIYFRS